MTNKPTLKQLLLRTQIILAPAFFGGFLGKDLLSGSVQTSKLIGALVIYSIVNLFIYLLLKSQIKSS